MSHVYSRLGIVEVLLIPYAPASLYSVVRTVVCWQMSLLIPLHSDSDIIKFIIFWSEQDAVHPDERPPLEKTMLSCSKYSWNNQTLKIITIRFSSHCVRVMRKIFLANLASYDTFQKSQGQEFKKVFRTSRVPFLLTWAAVRLIVTVRKVPRRSTIKKRRILATR